MGGIDGGAKMGTGDVSRQIVTMSDDASVITRVEPFGDLGVVHATFPRVRC